MADTNSMILNSQLDKVRKLATASKLGRMIAHPTKYIHAIFFREFVYKSKRVSKEVTASLFFDEKMAVALPSGTDIYLTGGKSHDSEIRLASFIINHLQPGDDFLDIGAHYGYFSRLAAHIIKENGKIVAVEPASETFGILSKNAAGKNIETLNMAVAEAEKVIHFYEFSNLQSEYNAMDVAQFENEQWFKDAPPKRIEIPATTIDLIIRQRAGFQPNIVKIDVEGAEFSVLSGGLDFLRNNNPFIVLEFLDATRQNEQHKKAAQLLTTLGYIANCITNDGFLRRVTDIEDYLKESNLESDNIVFNK